jgi:hypothetical protein
VLERRERSGYVSTALTTTSLDSLGLASHLSRRWRRTVRAGRGGLGSRRLEQP